MLAKDAYLENEVLTATPQKLRLLLIEGAIRFAHVAARCWQEGRNEEAFEATARCRRIVAELFAAIDVTAGGPAGHVYRIYAFLFGELTRAQWERDAERIRAVLRVLEEERETWRQVCEQMPEAPLPARELAPKEVTISNYAGPGGQASRIDASAAGPRLSFEA